MHICSEKWNNCEALAVISKNHCPAALKNALTRILVANKTIYREILDSAEVLLCLSVQSSLLCDKVKKKLQYVSSYFLIKFLNMQTYLELDETPFSLDVIG